MTGYPEHEIHSLAALIDWATKAPMVVWYRGQRRAEWAVLPSVFRRPLPELGERNQTNRFRSRAGVRRQVNPGPNDYAGWLSIMQHYGLRTRLLDWSRSPLIGAYFSVGKYREIGQEAPDTAIWVLCPHELNKLEVSSDYTHPIDSVSSQKMLKPAFKESGVENGKIVAVMGVEHDMRIFVQQGAFTIHSDQTPLDERVDCGKYLMKLKIPSSCVRQIADELYACGIRRGEIFPDLVNLADEMNGKA